MSDDTALQRGMIFHREGKFSEAIDCYQEVLIKNPANNRVLRLLGAVMIDGGKIEEGLSRLNECLRIEPHSAETLLTLGLAYGRTQERQLSAEMFKRAIEEAPNNPTLHFHFAGALRALDQTSAALAEYQRALLLKPNFTEVYHAIGELLLAKNKLPEALQAFHEALRQNPLYQESSYSAGTTCQLLGLWEEGLCHFARVLELSPENAPALNQLGLSLFALQRFEEAIASFQRALIIQPENPDTLTNLGRVFQRINRCPEAVSAHEKAIKLRPNEAKLYANLGNALLGLNEVARARSVYEQALAQDPCGYEQLNNLALAQLTLGNFSDGWELLHRKFEAQKPELARRAWKGDIPANRGRSILVLAEQGLGDTLQFIRYLPFLRELGFRVSILAQSSLKSLLSAQKWLDQVYDQNDAVPPFDEYCSILSLPWLLRKNVPLSIPPKIVPLEIPPEILLRVEPLLGDFRKPAIGLVWAGNPLHQDDHNRSMRLNDLIPLVRTIKAAFFSLQKEPKLTDNTVWEQIRELKNLGPSLKNFSETAAIVRQMDLVITVDTSVAHLAGTLGIPVWILLPYAADWRWQLERSDSPWYPSAHLFRQEKLGDWSGPLAQINEELIKRSESAGNS